MLTDHHVSIFHLTSFPLHTLDAVAHQQKASRAEHMVLIRY